MARSTKLPTACETLYGKTPAEMLGDVTAKQANAWIDRLIELLGDEPDVELPNGHRVSLWGAADSSSRRDDVVYLNDLRTRRLRDAILTVVRGPNG